MTDTNDKSKNVDNELDDLLNEFETLHSPVKEETSTALQPLKDLTQAEDLEKFIQNSSQDIITTGVSALKNLIADAEASGDPELIEAVGKFAQSVTSSIEILNKQVIKNKDIKAKIELEKLKRDETLKDGLDEVKGLVMSREEAFKEILKDIDNDISDAKKAIPVDSEEV